MDMLSFLGTVDIFKGLTEDERKELASKTEQVRFADGEAIVRQGEPGASVWVIVDGTAQVVKGVSGGKPNVLATLSSGQVFGEMSVMANGEPATADVAAQGAVNALKIPGNIFFRVFHKNPRALGKLSRDMARRYIGMVKR